MTCGREVFNSIMNITTTVPQPSGHNLKITREQFEQWQKQSSFDIMKGLRYGQSFCNHFKITDNILYYEFSWLNAEEYIKRTYIDNS